MLLLLFHYLIVDKNPRASEQEQRSVIPLINLARGSLIISSIFYSE